MRSCLSVRTAKDVIERGANVNDSCTSGSGTEDHRFIKGIREMLVTFGIPPNATYTEKAFMGMRSLLKQQTGRNARFVHTGGTSLVFTFRKGSDYEN